MVEIAQRIFEPLGYTVNYQTINWARALLYARTGEFDAVLGALREDAPDFVFPENPQGETQVGLFVRRNSNWQFDGPQSLKGRHIGLILDYAYGEDLQGLISTLAIPSYAGGDHPLNINIRKLQAGRLDIVVEDVGIFRHATASLGVADHFRLAHVFSREDIFIAFSPHSKDSARLARAGHRP
ncbi:substrate-binding periplasmic protein [Roseibium hamelinense]|nr:transporter substrate-binding domain-containing protein [Roseibium hamelinense]